MSTFNRLCDAHDDGHHDHHDGYDDAHNIHHDVGFQNNRVDGGYSDHHETGSNQRSGNRDRDSAHYNLRYEFELRVYDASERR